MSDTPENSSESRVAPEAQAPPGSGLRHAFGFFMRRMGRTAILETAASLSFSTVFALIPAIALLLAAVAAYPGLGDLRESMERFFLTHLMPDTGLQVGVAIGGFVRAAGQLTAFGVVGLIAAALILLISVESAFNKIFDVVKARRLAVRLLVFWTLMTIGPLFLGLGFSLFSVFAALPLFGSAEDPTHLDLLLGSVAPAVLGWLVLLLLYAIVPNRRVRLLDAALGALVAAVFLTALRYTFAFYVLSMTAYEVIYGALAAVPILLVWIYLVWIMVLVGAVVTASLPEWRHERSGAAVGPAGRLMTALSILERLEKAGRDGQGLATARLARAITAPDITFTAVLAELGVHRFVAATEGGEWMLARDLDRTPLADLVHCFGLGLGFGRGMVDAPDFADSETGRRIANALRHAAEAEQRTLSITLGRLIKGSVESG